ncbi:MAG: ABC transporter permease [Hamadaea sp.]|nr:ABC transporter permease [Hamadaea sp.]
MMLSVANVRGRWGSFAGSFATLVLGVTLIATTLLVYLAGSPRTPERLAAASVVVHAPAMTSVAGIQNALRPWSAAQTDRLTAAVRAVDGVTDVVADRSFYAQGVTDGASDGGVLGDAEGPPMGHGWSSARLGAYTLVEGREPRTDGELAVGRDLGVAVGAPLTLLTGDGSRVFTVVGTVDGPGYYVSDALAARLAPGVSALGVFGPASVADAVQAAVGDAGTAVTGDDRRVLEPEHTAKVRWLGTQLLTAMVALGGFVTVFVVSSTFALAALHRRREIGLLRLVGATPRQIRRMITGEALVVGFAAALVGAALSLATAPLLGRFLVRSGLANQDLVVRPAVLPLLVAVVTGVLVALAGAWSASRKAARTRPVEALRDAAVEKRPMSLTRWICAVLAAGGTGWLAVTTATASAEHRVDTALFTAMAAIVAATAFAPVVLGPLARLITLPLLRNRGAVGLLVRGETLAATRRTAATAAPVIATVGLAVLLSSMVATMREAYPLGEARELGGIAVAVPDGAPGLSQAALDAVGAATADLTTRAYVRDAVFEATGSPKVPAGTIVLSSRAADHLGASAGSSLSVTLPDGEAVSLRVGGIDRSLQPGDPDALLQRAMVREHDASALGSVVLGASTAPPAGLGVTVVDARTYAESQYAEDTRLLWLFAMVLIGLSVGYTGIAVANTMAMAAQSRRADRVVLARTGATRRQIRRVVATETVFVVGVGAGLGLAVVLPGLLGMRAGLAEETGADIALRLHWPTFAWVVAASGALALAAALGTLRRR